MTQEASEPQTVHVVDDDSAIRHAMCALLHAAGKHCVAYATADEFLDALPATGGGCLLLDINLPGTGGLELQEELRRRDVLLPIIFVTGHGDVPIAVQAMRDGAFDFLQKPFDEERLLESLDAALAADAAMQEEHVMDAEAARLYDSLTEREREVLDLVVTGKPNKVIAFDLGVSQRTVEIHRSRVMKKMRARSLADLVKLHLRISPPAD